MEHGNSVDVFASRCYEDNQLWRLSLIFRNSAKQASSYWTMAMIQHNSTGTVQ